MRTSKAEILADLAQGPDPSEPPTEYSAEDIRIQQYGDTAIVAFRLVGKVGGERPETLNFLNTGTFLKRNGEWRAVAWQATRVPVEPKQEATVNLTPGRRQGLASSTRSGRPTPSSSAPSSIPATSRPFAATSRMTSR